MVITTMALAMSSSSFSSSSAKLVSGSGFPRSISSSEHRVVPQIAAFQLLDHPHASPTAVRLSQRRRSVKPIKNNNDSKEQPSNDHSDLDRVRSNDCVRRIALPIFVGEDPDGWMFRIERYFTLYKIKKNDKLNYVSLAMEGEALAWYRWEDGRKKLRTWAHVKKLLLKRFRPTKGGTLLEQFLAIRQESTVREYRWLFEQYAAPLKEEGIELKDQVLGSIFVNGLKPDIREELRVNEPKDLEKKMEMAQQIEDKNIALGKSGMRTGHGRIIP